MVHFSGACHKHFRTFAQAEGFIADWVEMYACIRKAQIEEEQLEGHRPARMRGTPVGISSKAGGATKKTSLQTV